MIRFVRWLRSSVSLLYGFATLLMIGCIFLLFGGADTRAQEAILHHISNPVRSTIGIIPIFFMLSAGAWLHRPTDRASPFWLLLSLVSLVIGGMGGSVLIRLRQLLSFIPPAERDVAPGFVLTIRGLVSS